MRVVIPYAPTLDHHVVIAVNGAGRVPEPVNVSDSDEAYWELFNDLWAKGETFCVVEHDIVVRHDTLREIEECPSDWCSFLVPYVGLEYAGLACAKFSADLIARVPDAIAQVAETPGDEHHPPKHWCRLDAWLQGVLEVAGETKCVHGPPLEHLRAESDEQVRPSHGCWQ